MQVHCRQLLLLDGDDEDDCNDDDFCKLIPNNITPLPWSSI